MSCLTRLPAFVSTTVQLNPPTTPTDPIVPIDRDKVQVSVRDHPEISVDVDSNGTVTWTDQTQLAGLIVPGTYSLTYSRPGFADLPDQTFPCTVRFAHLRAAAGHPHDAAAARRDCRVEPGPE